MYSRRASVDLSAVVLPSNESEVEMVETQGFQHAADGVNHAVGCGEVRLDHAFPVDKYGSTWGFSPPPSLMATDSPSSIWISPSLRSLE